MFSPKVTTVLPASAFLHVSALALQKTNSCPLKTGSSVYGPANGLHVAPDESLDVQTKESPSLLIAKIILSERSKKELAMALDMLESLKRHSKTS